VEPSSKTMFTRRADGQVVIVIADGMRLTFLGQYDLLQHGDHRHGPGTTRRGTGDVCQTGLLTCVTWSRGVTGGAFPECEGRLGSMQGQGARVQGRGHRGPTELTSARARAVT
jgi:hypothetical protein